MKVRIPLPNCQHLAMSVHVVETDIPILIGMDILCVESFIPDFGEGIDRKKAVKW